MPRLVGLAVLALVGDYLCAAIGYGLTLRPGSVVVLWPAAGFLLAVLILGERRVWGALVLGAAIGGTLADLQHGTAFGFAVLAAVANCTESVAAAWVVTTIAGPRVALRTLREVMAVVFGAAVVSNAVTALLGAIVLARGGRSSYWSAWSVWWTGDGMGMLIVAPAILAWAGVIRARERVSRAMLMEAGIVLAAIAVVGPFVLWGPPLAAPTPARDPYLLFPLLLWMAARFGPLGATTGTLLLAGIAQWGGAHAVGPFGATGAAPLERVHAIYSYLALASVSTLIPASILAERRNAEQALRQSESRFRQLAEHIQEAFFIIDLDTARTLYVSPTWSEIWGLPPERAYDSGSWLEAIHPDDRQALLASQAAVGRGESTNQVLRVQRPDGSLRWIRARAFPVRNEAGRVYRLVGLSEDVTPEREMQAALREGDRVLRLQGAALEATADAIVITDPVGTIEWVNPAFSALTGYTPAEAIGRNPRALVKSDRQPREFYRELWETILSGRTWRGQLVNRRKDGVLYTEEQVITPIVDETGAITHFVSVKADVTERLRLEAQLRQSQKMETVGRLASGIAHDFNNLLTVINGMGEVVLASVAPSDPVHGDVEEMLRAGRRAADLTRQLLAFSRRQLMQSRVVNLNDVITATEPLLRRVLNEDVDLSISLAPDLGAVMADPGQLEQVILNLAVNARDAMPSGGRLTIETGNAEIDDQYAGQVGVAVPPGPYVQLSVADTGVGMDADTSSRIFDPFFTTKGPGQGTGLGLSTVYGIVKQSQGFIWVYTDPGQGTRFRVDLPRVSEAGRRVAAEHPGNGEPAGHETVLVVDDSAEVRTLVRRLLESAGYTVHSAGSGAEALRFLEQHREPLQLIVTDVVMPEMGGRELVQRLPEAYAATRVLFMSGHMDDTVLRHGVSHAQVPFLEKPFTRPALLQRVRDVLDA
jgi:PAS domain S-box-containing protein